MAITIRDVARKLNLSITTVSRALDGYNDVSEETRQRVIAMAQEMGYSPNRAARQLRRRKSDTIGYILPASSARFADPFYSEFIAGLGDEAMKHNLDLLISSAAPGADTEQQIYEQWVHGRKVDGFVLNRMRLSDWRVQYLSQNNFPFVTQERSLDNIEYASIEVDSRYWSRRLVENLLSSGYRRIAYIGGSPDLKIQADRYQGYQDALLAANLELNPEWIMEGDMTAEGGYQTTGKILALTSAPTAIVCIDDMTAMGAMHAAHDHGHVVGQDLAVTGFDGVTGFEHTQPPLTTVNQPVYQIARQLVQMLAALIQEGTLPEKRVQVQPVLEIRASTNRTSIANADL